MLVERKYNATSLARKMGVHYKTVLYWFKNKKIEGAYRSPTSNEILIPEAIANELLRQRGIVIK